MTTITVSNDHTQAFAPAETTISPGGTVKFNSPDQAGVTFYTVIGKGGNAAPVFVGQKEDGSIFAPHGEPASFTLLPSVPPGSTITMLVQLIVNPGDSGDDSVGPRVPPGTANGKINVGTDGSYT